MPDQPKQKTAVQEMIDYIEENFHLTEESRYEFKKALEKEKQQIMDSIADFDDQHSTPEQIQRQSEMYYTQTYNVQP